MKDISKRQLENLLASYPPQTKWVTIKQHSSTPYQEEFCIETANDLKPVFLLEYSQRPREKLNKTRVSSRWFFTLPAIRRKNTAK